MTKSFIKCSAKNGCVRLTRFFFFLQAGTENLHHRIDKEVYYMRRLEVHSLRTNYTHHVLNAFSAIQVRNYGANFPSAV